MSGSVDNTAVMWDVNKGLLGLAYFLYYVDLQINLPEC